MLKALSTVFFGKLLNSKGITYTLLGFLVLIQITNLIFKYPVSIDFQNIEGFNYFIVICYSILYCALTMLLISSVLFYITFIVWGIFDKLINKNESEHKFISIVEKYSFETAQKSISINKTALEWLIISTLLLMIIDKNFILQNNNVNALKNSMKSNFIFIMSIFSLCFIPSLLNSFSIISNLYFKFFSLASARKHIDEL